MLTDFNDSLRNHVCGPDPSPMMLQLHQFREILNMAVAAQSKISWNKIQNYISTSTRQSWRTQQASRDATGRSMKPLLHS